MAIKSSFATSPVGSPKVSPSRSSPTPAKFGGTPGISHTPQPNSLLINLPPNDKFSWGHGRHHHGHGHHGHHGHGHSHCHSPRRSPCGFRPYYSPSRYYCSSPRRYSPGGYQLRGCKSPCSAVPLYRPRSPCESLVFNKYRGGCGRSPYRVSPFY